MVWGSQQNGKLFLHCVTIALGRVMFRAFDFEKFICRLDKDLKIEKSLRRLGMVFIRSVWNSRISSV